MVRVVGIDEGEGRKPRRMGFLSGEIVVPDDFDAMAAEQIERLFGAAS
jgi:hypothetical protein